MTTIALKLAVALALCCVLGCSDDTDDKATQQNPSTTADASTPAEKPACDPGYRESCTPTTGSKPIRRCVCLKVD